MIRRDAGGDWSLINQADHAALAATLAGHLGGRRFPGVVAQRSAVISAVASHDDGWITTDELPLLDDRGRPQDVFDVPRPASLSAWAASTERATVAGGSYAGLLVSLHSLALSIRAAGPAGPGHTSFTLADARAVFEVNQFQHREIERQEGLRQAVGLPDDVPLTHGIADPGTDPGDDRLAYHFRLLQAMDAVSLALCCTHPPAEVELMPAPGAAPRRLRLDRDLRGDLRVSPWPFDVARLELAVRCRRLPARRFDSVEAFRAAYAAAPVGSITMTVRG